MQRMAVDFPEPDGPQITIRSPLRTVKETSFNAWNEPYHLLTLRISIIGGAVSDCGGVDRGSMGEFPTSYISLLGSGQFAFQRSSTESKRITDRKINQCHAGIDQKRLERGV